MPTYPLKYNMVLTFMVEPQWHHSKKSRHIKKSSENPLQQTLPYTNKGTAPRSTNPPCSRYL